MKMLKPILLFLALLLPVSIFLFLKIFGKNQFDVPLLYADGVKSKPANCNIEYPTPYVLPDSVFSQITSGKTKQLYLVNFSPEIDVVLERLQEEASTDEVEVVNAKLDDIITQCVLLLRKPYDLVLVDDQKQIRGYYLSTNREEVDRLLVEVSIILKKY